MSKAKALDNQVIVEERLFTEPPVPGQIILPESCREQLTENIVYAIGKNVKLEIKVGDRVFISKYGGARFQLDGLNLCCVNATEPNNEILAVYTGK